MTQDERLIELERHIKAHGKVTLEFICERFAISYDSARRDLVKLGEVPGILRIRGGAIANENKASLSYIQRDNTDPAKGKLTSYAATLVKSNDIVFLDAGTTNALIAKCLETESSVITNSLESLNFLSHKTQIKKCVLGGMFDQFSHAILGSMTIEHIKKYQADRAFIGVSALSSCGITTDTELDAELKLAMSHQSKQVICVATSDKFNTQLLYQSCSWEEIDFLITDQQPPQNILEQLQKFDVQLVVLDS